MGQADPRPAGPSRSHWIAAAWAVTLLASALPDALWNQLAGPTPPWLFWAKVVLLAAAIVVGWAWPLLWPLRPYFSLLGVNLLVWRALPWVRALPFWARWEGQSSWTAGMLGIQLLKAAAAALTVVVLLLLVRRRQDAFLVRGQLAAQAEPVRWVGMRDPTPWTALGPIVAVAGALAMGGALALSSWPSGTTLGRALSLLPVALLLSATNAASEELSYRSSLLAPLHSVVGKGQATALTAVFFGLAHYAGGVPLAALPTVLMTGFLGWWMAKAMLETKGFFWPWLIHLVNDIPVFFFLALGAAA
jgi:hypothetical protein